MNIPKEKICPYSSKKSPASTGSSITPIIVYYLLFFPLEIKVDEEGKEAHSAELQPLNTQRLEQRLKTEIEKKKKLIMAFKAGISPEGQRLFQVINKT